MKNIFSSAKKLLVLITVIFCSLNVQAQVPQALTYQAIARNASGSAIVNSNISIRISIKDVNATGPTLYSETQSVTTNQFGLFTMSVGTGLIQSGNFSNINWAAGSKFMKVEMDPTGGSGYIDMGTSQLLSVPYALMAGSLVGGAGGDNWGTQTANTNTTLTGNGTTVTPLGIAQQGAAIGQVLKWNGTTWAPATDLIGSSGGDNWGTQTVITSSALTGGGTFSSPLNLAQQGAVSGQVLKWNGATWAPGNDIDNDAQTLNISGSTLTISNGNSVSLPAQINYVAGSGINVTGNIISNIGDLSSTNELQTLSVAGNQLTISGGNSVAIPTNNYSSGTGISVAGTVISNTAPDQVVSLTGAGSASVGGAYPNFTISATDAQTLSFSGSTISISNGNSISIPILPPYTAGNGISIAGSVVTNSSPDQIVSLTGIGGATVTGVYPNFTISSTDNDAQTLSLAGNILNITNGNSVTLPVQLNYTSGAGIGIIGTIITNSAPDQIVALTGTGATTVTGIYPNFTINSTDTNTDAQTLFLTGNNLSISNGNAVTLPTQLNYTAGTGIGITGTVITNSAPDQTVTLIGTGASTVTGSYPNFTVNSTDVQTLAISNDTIFISNGNSVVIPGGSNYTAGTGITIAGNVINNGAPDQTVTLTGAGATTVSGTYPSFTITSTDNNTTYSAGAGIGIIGNVISNISPDQTVIMTGAGMSTVTGTYPAFTVNTIANTDVTLAGNGTAVTPLKIAQQGATNGQTLKWNGASWLPANDIDQQSLALVGNILSITNGNMVTLPTGTTYTAGIGISLAGNVISNTSPNQTVSLTGTGGTTIVSAYPNFTINSPTYTAGFGIGIVGNVITNTSPSTSYTVTAGGGLSLAGTAFSNNAQTDLTLSGNGTTVTPLKIAQQGATNGQVLQWNGTSWIPATMTAGGALGQTVNTTFGSDTIVINTFPIQYFLIPGLTQTINVPVGYSVFISTNGGVTASGTIVGSFSIIDIAVFLDGLPITSTIPTCSGKERIYTAYTTYLLGPFNYWSMSLSTVLTSGLHTISVQAEFVSGGLGCKISGDALSNQQGQLTVMLVKN